MTQSRLKIKKLSLVIGDVFALYFSLWLTLLIRYYNEYSTALLKRHLLPFTIVFVVWLIIFYIDELYEFDISKEQTNLINKLTRSLIISGVIATTFFYFGHNLFFSIKPQRVLFIDLIIAFILLYIWRQIFYSFIKSPKLAQNIVIIGANSLAKEVTKEINEKPQMGFNLKAIINPENVDLGNLKMDNDIKIINDIERLKDVCVNNKIDLIISAIDPRTEPRLLKKLFECLKLQVDFLELSSFYEKITGKVPVDAIGLGWFLENFNESSKKFYEIIKRITDIISAIILLILTLPVIPFIIIAIKLDSKGPFLFTQIRVGKNGKSFLAMKFRTMKVDAEVNGAQWAQANDPRITRIGKFLRKSRIDEIPQLVNVFRGEMSLIGPRPERPEFVKTLKEKIPFYEERLLVKPGLTGWAQVLGPSYGGSEKETMEKIQYDLFYIKNRSLGLDISIILKTIRIVLGGFGQ